MASLTDVYEGPVRTVTTSRRRYFGASCFAVGTAMVVGSILVATTTVGAQFGLGLIEARRLAGILAGLGLPCAFIGVFTVLPAGPTTRAASVIGASVSVLGVALFGVAYPEQWFGAGDPLAAATVLVYFFGAVTTLSCLFAGLATFKTRNDPGGTARMEITEEGSVRLVEDASVPGFGSVGLFGKGPDGEVQTQTNRETNTGSDDRRRREAEILGQSDGTDADGRGHARANGATADGGSATVDPRAETRTVDDRTGDDDELRDAEFVDVATTRGRPDAYCGNCGHFEYVKVDEKITPYCGLHDELMEDMDACHEWTEAN